MRDAQFQAGRLLSLRTRISAAYKGLYALEMANGGRDFRTGTKIDTSVYFDDAIDIHHIFPRAWCDKNGVEGWIADSAVNKTAIDAHTNRRISARAPSDYLKLIQEGDGTSPHELDQILLSHDIDPTALRADDFPAFFNLRFEALVRQIESVMGKPVNRADARDESPYFEPPASPQIDVAQIVEQGEGQNIEFKSTARFNAHTGTSNPKLEWSALKTIAGYANADGGRLVVGVDDQANSVGLDGDYSTLKKKDRDGWELWLTDAVSTSMGKLAAALLQVQITTHDGVDVALVESGAHLLGPSSRRSRRATESSGSWCVSTTARRNSRGTRPTRTRKQGGPSFSDYFQLGCRTGETFGLLRPTDRQPAPIRPARGGAPSADTSP